MQAGAAGYLSKGAAPQEVVSAIRSVYSGQRYIASDIAQQMALSQIEPEKTESPFASLSERELQIMLMITKGQKVNENLRTAQSQSENGEQLPLSYVQ